MDAPKYVGVREASRLLGFGPQSRWLTRPDCPIPRHDIRKPGAARPTWVWDYADLTAFVTSRKVEPGHPNPQAIR